MNDCELGAGLAGGPGTLSAHSNRRVVEGLTVTDAPHLTMHTHTHAENKHKMNRGMTSVRRPAEPPGHQLSALFDEFKEKD